MAVTAATEQNMATVRRFVDEVFNGRDYEALEGIWADDVVQHGPVAGVELHGFEECREYLEGVHGAFSDLECTEEFCVADGDLVASYYTYRGTHDGEFMGIEPTGESAEIAGMVLNRVEDGEITESWVVADFFGLMAQVGAVETPAA